LAGAALVVSCGALALGVLVAVINGASNNGALVTRVGNLEVLAVKEDRREERIESKLDALNPEDGKIAVLQEQVTRLDSQVQDHEQRWRVVEMRSKQRASASSGGR
jgi:hypothetical protein